MQLQTILNRVEKHPSFVYRKVQFAETSAKEAVLEVEVLPRANSRPQSGPGINC